MLLFRRGPTAPLVALGGFVTALTLGAFAMLGVAQGNWKAWAPATCLSSSKGCFCEKDRSNTLLRQPANTFSNIAFTIVGVLVLIECGLQQMAAAKRKQLPSPDEMLGVAYTCTYASSQIFLGFGSAWYHASLAFVGQFIDNAGMFLAVSAPLLFARASLRRSGTNQAKAYLIEYVSLNSICGFFAWQFPMSRRYIFLLFTLWRNTV